ncbi:MAG: hypothetical protein A2287_04105 [Candidatus Melainabacteria bacterium RIFOXYA12_FULL_32_12]|nr:MAG: hypothetical protein A2255_02815 [Candidatus Melainabacteria bacterium RIFOXYA2_FULL_32_9]OGI29430.1 MAG: hypothetical protein A2287_04105 [Candidatus Melainabacteria bacterium RIFOXYA12_FULL_32_12]
MDIKPVSLVNDRLNIINARARQEKGASVPVSQNTDNVQFSSQEKPKVGVIQKVKNFIFGAKKAYVTVVGYTKAAIGGTITGGILGGLTYGGLKAVDFVKNFRKEKEAIKHMPKPLIIGAAAAVGLAKLGITLFNASLDISEARNNLDHRRCNNLHNV